MNQRVSKPAGKRLTSRLQGWFLIVAGFILWTTTPCSLLAAEEFSLGQKGDKPTTISAQKLIYNQAANQVEFVGDVHVVRSDFELWCKTMSVFLAEQQKKGQKGPGIERIVARDEVRTRINGRESFSDEAVYQTGSEVITLQGNVLIKEGLNQIEGGRVVLYLNENRTEIFSAANERVNAVFYPSEDEQ